MGGCRENELAEEKRKKKKITITVGSLTQNQLSEAHTTQN